MTVLRRALSLAAVLPVLIISACTSSADDEGGREAPEGASFYEPPADLSEFTHGDVIWSREQESTGLTGSSSTLVLYAQEGVAGETVGTSGVVTVPDGEPPKGGWPIVAWAHGTTGIADRCAPSRLGEDISDPAARSTTGSLLQRWIDAGYAVVATDYEGLGTPGDHPYLIGTSQGRAVLDSVRAARQLDDSLSERILVAGHSQGGHAALWASSLAPRYTRELDLIGTVAFAPASHLSLAVDAALSGDSTVPAAFGAMLLLGLDVAYPGKIGVEKLLNERGRELYPLVRETCLPGLFAPDAFGVEPMSGFIADGVDGAAIKGPLDANDPSVARIDGPVLIVQGTADTTVPKVLTDQLVATYEQRGIDVTYAPYPGGRHTDVLDRSAKRVTAFSEQVRQE